MKTPFRHWFSTQISIQRKPLPDQEKQIKTRPEWIQHIPRQKRQTGSLPISCCFTEWKKRKKENKKKIEDLPHFLSNSPSPIVRISVGQFKLNARWRVLRKIKPKAFFSFSFCIFNRFFFCCCLFSFLNVRMYWLLLRTWQPSRSRYTDNEDYARCWDVWSGLHIFFRANWFMKQCTYPPISQPTFFVDLSFEKDEDIQIS